MVKTRYDGAHLQSQCAGGGCKRVLSLSPAISNNNNDNDNNKKNNLISSHALLT